MSGFDVTMRSQQQVQQGQQFYDSQRYQMMGQTGQAIAQAPAMLQEISLRQQDADMRLALQQQEFQSNAMKLQAMTAIDQADLMREQVRGAKLQNDAIEFDMSTRREQMGMQREQMFDVRFERLVNAIGGGRGAAASGLKVDPDGKRLIPMTDTEKKAMASDTSGQERQQEWLNLSREMTAAKAMIEDGSDEEGGQQRLRDIAARMAEISTARRTAPPPARPGTRTPPAPVDPVGAERTRRLSMPSAPHSIVGNLAEGGDPSMFGGFQPAVAESTSNWMTQNKQSIHDYMRKVKDPEGRTYAGDNPDATIDRLIDELRDAGSPFRMNILQMLVSNGVITIDQARSVAGQ